MTTSEEDELLSLQAMTAVRSRVAKYFADGSRGDVMRSQERECEDLSDGRNDNDSHTLP
jgi:hypothetical protein